MKLFIIIFKALFAESMDFLHRYVEHQNYGVVPSQNKAT